MSIALRISDIWPMTERELASELGAVEYASMRERRTDDAIRATWRTFAAGQAIPNEYAVDQLDDDVLEQYVANLAVLRMIPAAKDMYKDQQLSKNRASTLAGSLGDTFYNKLDYLDQLEERLKRDNALLAVDVATVLSPLPTVTVTPQAPLVSFNPDAIIDPVADLRRRRGY